MAVSPRLGRRPFKPPYEQLEQWKTWARAEVERKIESLKGGAFDAGLREMLNNFINALAKQARADLDREREEQRAKTLQLVGMASQKVARLKPRYDADMARASHARAALAEAFEALTGRKATEDFPVAPSRTVDGSLHSTVGTIHLGLDDDAISEPDSGDGSSPDTAGTSDPGLDYASDHLDRDESSDGES